MSDVLRIGSRVTLPRAELSVRFSRSSGPGGQGVNTTDSRVELSFDLMASPSVPDFLKERAAERLPETGSVRAGARLLNNLEIS